MKNVKKLLLVALSSLVLLGLGFAKINAETEIVGDNVILNGDFSAESGELPFGDPAFGADKGVCNGWGSGVWDSHVTAVKDPLDAENTCIKYAYTTEGLAFSSFFKFASLLPNTTYQISFDYLVVGTTDNFGFRLVGTSSQEVVFYSGSATTTWQHYSVELTTGDGTYDSIASWMNTGSSTENIGYLDNIVVKVSGSDTNVISGGDFEGFLAYAPALSLSETPDDYGNTGVNASYSNGYLLINDSGSFAQSLDLSMGKYRVEFDLITASGLTSSDNLSVSFISETNEVLDSVNIIEAGEISSLFTGEKVSFDLETTAAIKGIKIDHDGSMISVDNLFVAEILEYPFDSETTYYQSRTMTVNGDFEAFALDTAFSQEQLEGAWGSLDNYDNPAVIKDIDGSHVIDLTSGDKTYSSCFLMLPDTLEAGELLRLSYDVKLVLSNDASSYTAIDSSLVGGSNVEYYTVDYRSLSFALSTNETSGDEKINYPITITAKENGWYNISFDFQITSGDLIRTNSLRFLFTALSGDHMYIDNVNLYELSTEEFNYDVYPTSITFDDGLETSLSVGDNKTLAYTISPEDVTIDEVTFSSSDESICTVSSSGVITGISAGSCVITVETANNKTAQIAVTVNAPLTEGPSTGTIVAIVVGSVVLLAGVTLAIVLPIRHKRNKK